MRHIDKFSSTTGAYIVTSFLKPSILGRPVGMSVRIEFSSARTPFWVYAMSLKAIKNSSLLRYSLLVRAEIYQISLSFSTCTADRLKKATASYAEIRSVDWEADASRF